MQSPLQRLRKALFVKSSHVAYDFFLSEKWVLLIASRSESPPNKAVEREENEKKQKVKRRRNLVSQYVGAFARLAHFWPIRSIVERKSPESGLLSAQVWHRLEEERKRGRKENRMNQMYERLALVVRSRRSFKVQ